MFVKQLQDIVDKTEGAWAGLLMGFDGIAVEQYTKPAASVDLLTVSMEFSFLLNQARKAVEILDLGGLQEVAIHTQNLTLLMRVLQGGYFLALAMDPQGLVGQARYQLRMQAPYVQASL